MTWTINRLSTRLLRRMSTLLMIVFGKKITSTGCIKTKTWLFRRLDRW